MTATALHNIGAALEGIRLTHCRGSVVRVSGLTVQSKGPPVGVGQMCDIVADGRRIAAEVIGFHDELRVLAPLEGVEGIAPGSAVIVRNVPRTISIDRSILGRVLDGLGRPIDGLGPLTGRDVCPLDNNAPPPLSRQRIDAPLATGVRSIDGLLTMGMGQRIGIFAGSGVGKSTLLGQIARSSDADVNVLALVGERGREVREFIEDSLGPAGLARSVVLVATSDACAVQRVKVAFTATAVAEYFRDQGLNVMFMMDSLTRFAQAQREIGLAAGEPPTTKGYCPSVFSMLPKLTERLGRSAAGSITGIYTVLVEGDDMNDPVADSVRSLLDGHVVLSRKLAHQGHYPAVDILQSVSRLMPAVASAAHVQAAQRLRAICATHQGAEDLINIGAYARGSNPRIDKAIDLIDGVNALLMQGAMQPSSLEATVEMMQQATAGWDFGQQLELQREAGP